MTKEMEKNFKDKAIEISKILSEDEFVCDEKISGEMLVAKAFDILNTFQKEIMHQMNDREVRESCECLRKRIKYFEVRLDDDMTAFEYARYENRKVLKEKGII